MRTLAAAEAGERPARLTHQDVERGEVPHRHFGFGGDVDGAFGEQAVGQEVAIAAYPPDCVGEFDEAVAQTELGQDTYDT